MRRVCFYCSEKERAVAVNEIIDFGRMCRGILFMFSVAARSKNISVKTHLKC